jgi:hypothetical protein
VPGFVDVMLNSEQSAVLTSEKSWTMDELPKIELVRDTEDSDLKAPAGVSTARLNRWLAALVERGGSDLLLVHGSPACIRSRVKL